MFLGRKIAMACSASRLGNELAFTQGATESRSPSVSSAGGKASALLWFLARDLVCKSLDAFDELESFPGRATFELGCMKCLDTAGCI